jgi:hypothetical protein
MKTKKSKTFATDVYAVNERGEYMQDLIMKTMLGTDIPAGFKVGFKDGNTLNNLRANLMLVPIKTKQ